MSNFTKYQKSERGGAGVKLTMVLIFLFLVAHAGYRFGDRVVRAAKVTVLDPEQEQPAAEAAAPDDNDEQ